MHFHTIYRATHSENTKPRPRGYDGLTCLRSFLRARAACRHEGERLFLNNGPMPPDQIAAMQSAGTIVAREGLDAQESFSAGIDLALERGWADEDLVYFAEDDYLFRREAFAGLCHATEQLPTGAYLAPYATIGHRMPNGEPLHDGMRRPRVSEEPLVEAGGVTWRRGLSHTGSFAVRVGTLRADRRIHSIAPRCGGGWDHALSLAYQGIAPFGPAALAEPMRLRGVALERRVKAVVWRTVLTGLAAAARPRRRVLASSRPALTTHLVVGLLALGTDWVAVAEAARRWSEDDG